MPAKHPADEHATSAHKDPWLTWNALVVGVVIALLLGGAFLVGGLADRLFVLKPVDYALQQVGLAGRGSGTAAESTALGQVLQTVQTGSVADIVETAGKSVVTVSIKTQRPVFEQLPQVFFPGFGLRVPSGAVEEVQQDIGTGFVVDQKNGLIVTNKHVVSDTQAQYKIIDSNDKEYDIINIYRDPVNDLAIVKVENLELAALPLGDSDKIRVGEGVIAIGTALGEFRNTVTTGVVSGLGRGISASDGSMMAAERLENVIQTDAAINPGNSGGPLIGAGDGRVIGVSVAVTQGAQNIGFSIPINVVKAVVDNFNQTGQFDRPMLGVSYRIISQQTALMNDVPQGAYIQEVVPGSAAQKAGIQQGDIISSIDGQSLRDSQLAEIINKKKIGDSMEIKLWRNGEEQTMRVTLQKVAE
jgi:serine protease Do